MDADPVKVVEMARKTYGLTEDEKSATLRNLISGADLTQYGLAQAVTRMSADVVSYDRATDLEAAGAQIIEMGDSPWQQMLKQAAALSIN
jgi:hypothetical protein